MKAKLCLHGVDVKHQAQLVGLVKKLLPSAKVSYKVKEKYFPDNDMYKCRVARFQPKSKGTGYRVLCSWGVLLVCDKLVNVADITLEFARDNAAAVAAVRHLLEQLLAGKQHFVLDEPDLARRLDLLRGRYYLDNLEGYDRERATTALSCHVPWQLYSINKLWEQLLWGGGTQRTLWRQLRVKLRRLRSVLSLVKPLFSAADYWKELVKKQADVLSDVREYDVLLQTCERLRGSQGRAERAALFLRRQGAELIAQSTLLPAKEAVPSLQHLLAGLRQQAQARVLQQLELNAVTNELAQIYLYLLTAGNAPCDRGLQEFFAQRLGKWAKKLQQQGVQPELGDMEHLHRVRIKLKRFRYALQCVPEVGAAPQLLRSLKCLQDLLGVVHDDYVNDNYLQQLVAAHDELPELRYEVALLRGYEQAKADGALEQLAIQWQEFSRLLSEWIEELE